MEINNNKIKKTVNQKYLRIIVLDIISIIIIIGLNIGLCMYSLYGHLPMWLQFIIYVMIIMSGVAVGLNIYEIAEIIDNKMLIIYKLVGDD